VSFESGTLRLEGVLFTPDQNPRRALVVVCHPHPRNGGSMENNVVMAIVRALYEHGIAALAFNFRGVGGSQGAYDGGKGEQDDVCAALAFAANVEGIERVGLAGYSFGAGVAAAVVDDSVAALALVSPAASRLDTTSLPAYAGPMLLTAGLLDHVAPLEALERAATRARQPAQVVSVPGVDHFWWGHEARLREIVGGFFAGHLAAV
jgi:alpha/beta superfamily hydrolase